MGSRVGLTTMDEVRGKRRPMAMPTAVPRHREGLNGARRLRTSDRQGSMGPSCQAGRFQSVGTSRPTTTAPLTSFLVVGDRVASVPRRHSASLHAIKAGLLDMAMETRIPVHHPIEGCKPSAVSHPPAAPAVPRSLGRRKDIRYLLTPTPRCQRPLPCLPTPA